MKLLQACMVVSILFLVSAIQSLKAMSGVAYDIQEYPSSSTVQPDMSGPGDETPEQPDEMPGTGGIPESDDEKHDSDGGMPGMPGPDDDMSKPDEMSKMTSMRVKPASNMVAMRKKNTYEMASKPVKKQSTEKKTKKKAVAKKKSRKESKGEEKVVLTEAKDDKKPKKSFISSRSADVDVVLGGRIREDAFYFDKVQTFRGDLDDTFFYIRSRVELEVLAEQGKRKYGKPASEAGIKLTSYTWWKHNSQYLRQVRETTRLAGLDNAATGDRHFHEDIVPKIFMEEGWFKLNFGTFIKPLEKYPISLKMGFFFYQIGRGLSLGFHGDMALLYAGWAGEGDFTRFPAMPPGLLLTGQLSKNISWDFYYNKWRGFSHPRFATAIANANHLTGPRPHRGKDKDRDTWAFKMKFEDKHKKIGDYSVEPYLIYTRAPEQPIETISDAKSRLGTVGFMWDHTFNQFNVNVEVAGQFGQQQVFGIDRNEVMLRRDRVTGNVQEQYSHIFFDSQTSRSFVPVKNSSTNINLQTIVNLPHNRTPERNGQQILAADGATPVFVVPAAGGVAQQIFNSNFFGNARFRKPYKLDYRGLMALADVAYTFKNYPFQIAGAVGYIGGDQYPYNEEKDKTFKSFITQRALYAGHHVQPVFMFERVVLARPLNITYRTLAAENDYRDYSNIQFIGAGMTWFPLKDRKMMSLNPNVIGFWEVGQLKKWDKDANPPLTGPALVDFQTRRTALNFKGWLSEQNASKFLGTELNLIFKYQFLQSCLFYFKGYAFLPGQLYKDLEGQPNVFALRQNANLDQVYNGLGSHVASGFYTGFDYKF